MKFKNYIQLFLILLIFISFSCVSMTKAIGGNDTVVDLYAPKYEPIGTLPEGWGYIAFYRPYTYGGSAVRILITSDAIPEQIYLVNDAFWDLYIKPGKYTITTSGYFGDAMIYKEYKQTVDIKSGDEFFYKPSFGISSISLKRIAKNLAMGNILNCRRIPKSTPVDYFVQLDEDSQQDEIEISSVDKNDFSLNTKIDGERYALVIGNSDYVELGSLKNPVNDANDIKKSLELVGFEVELLINADQYKMEDAVVRLGNKLSTDKNSVGLFYYAGHGIQSEGENYLIPSGARIASASFLKSRALSAQVILDELRFAGNKLNTIILDACRDNPFSWSRSATRGLSVVASQPADSIIVYATSAGSVAQDGSGRNGLFTSELLKHLSTPGLEISEVFRRTGAGVQQVSGGAQVPAVYNQFFGKFYLTGN